MGEGRWSLPSPFLGTASSSIPPCGNNTRKQPAGDYSGERRNLSGVSLSRLRLRKHAVTSLCALKTDSYTSTTRVPKSKAAAFQQRAEESPAPDCKSQRSCPSGLHHVLFSPLRFFFPVHVYWDVVHPVSLYVRVCGTRSWKEFHGMIGFPCQALTNTPTSYGIPSLAAEDVAPRAFFLSSY